jgi:hypothetical protein
MYMLIVIKYSLIFSQISDDLPLGAEVNPTKFGVNWRLSFLQKSLIRKKLNWRQFTPNFLGLTPAPMGRSFPICKKIEQHLWKF